MIRVDEGKLTDFDRQLLTTFQMTQSEWGIQTYPPSLGHTDFGWTESSLFGLGMQLRGRDCTPNCRRLSWRAQILLRREWRALLRSGVARPGEFNMAKVPQLEQPPRTRRQGRLANLISFYGLDSMVPSMTMQAAAMNAGLSSFSKQLANRATNPPVTSPPPTHAPPTVETVFGFTYDELKDAGFSSQEISALKRTVYTSPSLADEALVERVLALPSK